MKVLAQAVDVSMHNILCERLVDGKFCQGYVHRSGNPRLDEDPTAKYKVIFPHKCSVCGFEYEFYKTYPEVVYAFKDDTANVLPFNAKEFMKGGESVVEVTEEVLGSSLPKGNLNG